MKHQIRYALAMLAVALAGFGGLVAFQRLERFLITDARFVVTPPPEYGEDTPSLRIEGTEHTARGRIMNVFHEDFGRSVYLLPLAERRRTLMDIDWVKEASVSRVWPNRLQAKIVERKPVAFVQLPAEAGAAVEFGLIDEDGVILRPQAPGRFALPVLVGIRRQDSPAARRDRVHRMLRLLEELGPLAEKVSEVEVSDPENLRVTEQIDGHAVVLILGNRRFQTRLANFQTHYAEIRRRLPAAATFDLRLEDRITAVEGAAVAQ